MAPAGAGGTVAPSDTDATDAYLRAEYAYDLARQAALPQITAAASAFAASVRSECPSVPAEPRRNTRLGPREFGEEGLRRAQREELGEELERAAVISVYAPEREAYEAFVAAVSPLRWSNPGVAAAVAADLAEADAVLLAAPPPACADIRAWIADPHHRLSAATKAFLAAQEAREQELRSQLLGKRVSLDGALRADADAEGRGLISRTTALVSSLESALRAALEEVSAATRAVGLSPFGEAEGGERERSVVELVGTGSTRAGAYRLEVTVAPKRRRTRCPYQLQVGLAGSNQAQLGGQCLPAARKPAPRAVCEEGLRIVEALLPANVHSVRLLLSSGRTLTSRTIAIPSRFGGPAAFYLQAVAVGAGMPLEMTELGARGSPLRQVKLPATTACVRHSVQFLHHGIQIIARGLVPGGPGYAIKGEAFRWQGQIQFNMSVEIQNAGGGGQSLGGRRPRVFERAVFSQCSPHQYEIVYGLLHAPGATVTAEVGGVQMPLSKVAIPAHLHAHGVLVYGAFGPAPERLTVRDAHGHTIVSEDLRTAARQSTEYCEGLTEEPGQPVRDSGTSIGGPY